MEQHITQNLELFDFMKKLNFFGMLEKNALWPLSNLATSCKFEQQELIISEGAEPIGIFIIKNGTVEVFKTRGDGSELHITDLSSGEIIGEVSVIDKLKTTASVRAREAVECIFISEWDFTTQLHAYPEIGLQILPILAARLRILYETIK